MAYLGKTPSQAVRSRYYFTATGGETSLSGTDDNSNTLTFTDGNYVDVALNGVTLVAGTDYNTTTTNTIGGLTALVASDVVEVIVYDTFSVFSGNVNGDFTVGGTLTAASYSGLPTTTLTSLGIPNHDDITVDASGNVGIGTSPLAKFHVNNTNSAFYMGYGGNEDIYLQTTNGNVLFTNKGATTERMRITSAGNVGIGTTTTQGKLDVHANGGGGTTALHLNKNDTTGYFIIAEYDGTLTSNRTYTLKPPSSDSSTEPFIWSTGNSHSWEVDGSEAMRIDSSGQVGIGTSSPEGNLHVNSAGNALLNVTGASAAFLRTKDTAGGTDEKQWDLINDNGNVVWRFVNDANTATASIYNAVRSGNSVARHEWYVGTNSEAMRIDSSGNLLVGKTSTAIEDVGLSILSTGRLIGTANNDDVLVLRRNTSDGDIISFRKDGTTVGSIGSEGGDSLYIVSGDTGIRFSGGADVIIPVTTNGAVRDNAIDLGMSSSRFQDLYLSGSAYTPVVQGLGDEAGLTFGGALVAPRKNNAAANGTVDLGASSARFKDFYLSGGVYLGGTGSANKLDDYEEGSWTPVYTASGGSVTMGNQFGKYIKIGNAVFVYCHVSANSSSLTGTLEVTGLPYTSIGGVSYGFLNATNATWSWGTHPKSVYVASGSNKIRFWDSGTNQITGTHMTSGAGSQVIFTLQYQAD